MAVQRDLCTREAADFLNISHSLLATLLESGELPFHRTGRHRRVRFDDLTEYKARRDEAREQAMTELAAQAQALRMGYE
jgi:excisionase family DNA binding protein